MMLTLTIGNYEDEVRRHGEFCGLENALEETTRRIVAAKFYRLAFNYLTSPPSLFKLGVRELINLMRKCNHNQAFTQAAFARNWAPAEKMYYHDPASTITIGGLLPILFDIVSGDITLETDPEEIEILFQKIDPIHRKVVAENLKDWLRRLPAVEPPRPDKWQAPHRKTTPLTPDDAQRYIKRVYPSAVSSFHYDAVAEWFKVSSAEFHSIHDLIADYVLQDAEPHSQYQRCLNVAYFLMCKWTNSLLTQEYLFTDHVKLCREVGYRGVGEFSTLITQFVCSLLWKDQRVYLEEAIHNPTSIHWLPLLEEKKQEVIERLGRYLLANQHPSQDYRNDHQMTVERYVKKYTWSTGIKSPYMLLLIKANGKHRGVLTSGLRLLVPGRPKVRIVFDESIINTIGSCSLEGIAYALPDLPEDTQAIVEQDALPVNPSDVHFDDCVAIRVEKNEVVLRFSACYGKRFYEENTDIAIPQQHTLYEE